MQNLTKNLLLGTASLLVGCAFFASCGSSDQHETDILAAHVDTTVRPQDDFLILPMEAGLSVIRSHRLIKVGVLAMKSRTIYINDSKKSMKMP
ncbi:hypothetical protein FSB73_15390 [Arachidicoccus ginsenosidivorans]|uniref:Uncharacterized protein n=1 Tax=Arachidicoccus ginsenosidivorans TaxID=496057 RepID=A0A5B8VRF0_9BACT|nr:hypothetical protein [Arachidicoccus ginsenosidivorans]QEC72858.1 hypothetical protein FSB73_15390 [Arachidicoccus ginsenosidivorans]